MRRTFRAMIALTLAVFAVRAHADLCPNCRELMYTADIGKCAECGGGGRGKGQAMKAMLLRQIAPVETAPLMPAGVPDPEPGPGEVRVRVKCCAISGAGVIVVE